MTDDRETGQLDPVAANDTTSGAGRVPVDEERFRLLVDSVTDYAIFMLDPAGHVVSWNPGAERIKGYRPAEIIGKHFSVFYPSETVARGFPMHELEVAGRVGRFEDEGWRLRKDGTPFWANVVITALRDTSGELVGFAKVTRDLTERRRQGEALRQSEERFRLMVESVRDYAIFTLDAGGHIMSWNVGAERIKGYRPEEIIGQHFSIFYPPEALSRGLPAHELQVAGREGRFEDEGWRVRKDGSPFWANVVITALFDSAGRPRGFAKITRDLTQRRRLETLEQEGRQTTEFLAMLAHELRSPLAPIRNVVEILRAREVDDPTVTWARDLIDRQVSHLSRLVDDLLDMSRITSGKISINREPLDLGALVASAVDAARPLLEERHHQLSLTLLDEHLRVEGDATRLSQVVLNLVNNAAKYTPNGGHVWVTVAREKGQAVLRVRDDGIGMAPELLPRVFDLFVQGERALDRSEGGLGIGLTLVRNLVDIHGGTVEAYSAGPGRGSEFVVRLPTLLPPTADAASTRRRGAPFRNRPRSVLVVDDNADSAETMATLLQIWGHDVRIAGDGPAALALATDQRPDVVLLDIGLPGMTGYEVAERLRQLPDMADAVLVAMTGYGQEDDRQKSREAGFTLHLVKPIQPDTLHSLFA
jgi:PAS domain S-box-containing protein